MLRVFAASVLTAVILGLIVLAVYRLGVPAAGEAAKARSAPSEPALTIVAMGDSYMSGEGAGRFYTGTDLPGRNSCRRAPTAYSVRVADALGADLHFTACSGARTYNIGSRFGGSGPRSSPQFSDEPLQIEALRAHREADVVLLSIGGNDARFSEVVSLCAGRRDSCVPEATGWMNNLDEVVQPALRELYAEVRSLAGERTRIFVTTYPVPFEDGVTSCDDVGMATDEVGFIREFVGRLNAQIVFAALDARFELIDLSTALQSGGLCSSGSGAAALNAWRWQRPARFPRGPVDPVRGSFHPTEYGHGLLATRVLARLREPGAPSTAPPTDGPAGPPPDLPPDLPPYVPDEFGPPVGPFVQDKNPCTPVAARREAVQRSERVDRFSGARANSRVCYRTYQGGWQTTRADTDGRVTVEFARRATTGIGGYRRVLYRDRAGEWVQRTLQPDASAAAPDVWLPAAWLTGQTVLLLVLIAVVALALVAATVRLAWWIAGAVHL